MKNFILALVIVLLALSICQGCGTLGEDDCLDNPTSCSNRYVHSDPCAERFDGVKDVSTFFRVEKGSEPKDLYLCYTQGGGFCRGEGFPPQKFVDGESVTILLKSPEMIFSPELCEASVNGKCRSESYVFERDSDRDHKPLIIEGLDDYSIICVVDDVLQDSCHDDGLFHIRLGLVYELDYDAKKLRPIKTCESR